ncbi:HAD family hydrolase [Cellvibrio polysaccharolyticus]|uniref:phosphoglycolate phosphatase n=1 Tax=Cellvibrio polysaccharolyticus TaxID=2082724 RepID=A0A928V7J9_9GAMM|nr:HAD hydrolase-like protein [Cellvibrio polysaccharolyticus]MBE8718356.1 HAD family hydrolase [Cellvibrio polysaccharolyticus]
MKLDKYKTIIFDCDGVLLNSNRVKTEAFFKAALPYGTIAAQKLVDYHVARGGISRYEKFEWFLKNIVMDSHGPDIDQLLMTYASEVRVGLLTCDIAPGLQELKMKTERANWLVASGGDQNELREVFHKRNINDLFDQIFGSPDSKETILSREKESGNLNYPALFIGDSRYDHVAATKAGLEFIFLSGWSEFNEWEHYCETNKILHLKSISELTM